MSLRSKNCFHFLTWRTKDLLQEMLIGMPLPCVILLSRVISWHFASHLLRIWVFMVSCSYLNFKLLVLFLVSELLIGTHQGLMDPCRTPASETMCEGLDYS